jgi:hypothetical protein
MNGTSLFEFTKESFFLIDLRTKNFDNIKKNIKNIEKIIPSQEELQILDNYKNELKTQLNNPDNINEVNILKDYNSALEEFCPGIQKLKNEFILIDDIIK